MLMTRTKRENRREQFELEIPLLVRWTNDKGLARQETAKTQMVSDHDCLLLLKTPLLEGNAIELLNLTTQSTRKGKVIWCGEASADGRNRVGIELEQPSPEFWGTLFVNAMRLNTLSCAWVG